MNPLWILVGMGALWLLLHLCAGIHEDRRASAGDGWRGDRREELRSLRWALCLLPLLPLEAAVNLPRLVTSGRPLLWGVALGVSILWLLVVIPALIRDDELGRDENPPPDPLRQLTSHDMSIGASPSGGGSQDAQPLSGGGVGS